MNEDHVMKEVESLIEHIKRLGAPGPDGKIQVRYVELIDDKQCCDTFEAIFGTLKAARKRDKVSFEGEILLKGVHDDTLVTLL